MAQKQLFTNNAISLLRNPLTASDTTLSVLPGQGALFPNPGPNEFFLVTLEDEGALQREIIKVTARAGDVFTVIERGFEGTIAQAWSATIGNDTLVDHRVTAQTMTWAMELPDNLGGYPLDFTPAPTIGQVLRFNGTSWAPSTISVGSTGTVTSVQATGGTTGLTFSGGPITTAGTLTLGGTLGIANGGTGATTASGALTNIGVPFYVSTAIAGIQLDDLADVNTPSPNLGDVLTWSGTEWKALAPTGGGSGTVTSVSLVEGSGQALFDFGGSPVTTVGTLNFNFKKVPGGAVLMGGPVGSLNQYPEFRRLAVADIEGIDVDTTPPTVGQVLKFDGTNWVPAADATGTSGGSGTVTSVNILPGTTGLTVTGGPITTSGSFILGGVLDVAHGGTGAASLTGYIRGNGTSAFTTTATIPTSDLSGAINLVTQVTDVLPIANGGTGQATAQGALNALLPSQAGNSGRLLSTDGTNASWIVPPAGSGTVTSVGISMPAHFTVTNSPITSAGTISISLNTQAAGTVLAAPAGAAGTPTFRALSIGELADVDVTTASPVIGEVLLWNGTSWAPSANNASVGADLNVIEGLSGVGLLVRTGTETWQLRTLSGTAGNITISSSNGVGGDPTINLETVGSAGTFGNSTNIPSITTDGFGRVVAVSNIAVAYPVTSVFGRTGAVVAQAGDYMLNQLGDVSTSALAVGQQLRFDGSSWVNFTPPTFLTDPANNGIVIRTGSGVTTARLTAGGTGISVANADGTAGNITITNTGVTSITGTTNEIDVSSTTGGVTISVGPQLAALAAVTSNGLLVRTSSNTFTTRTLDLFSENSSGGQAVATGNNSVAIGNLSQAQAAKSLAIGEHAVTRIPGAINAASGRIQSSGDAQSGTYHLKGVTTNGIAKELFVDGPAGTQRIVLSDDSTFMFTMHIAAHRTDGSGRAGFFVKGVVYRENGAATTAIQGVVHSEIIARSDDAWDVNIGVNTAAGGLQVLVTGEAGKTIRWLARVETAELTN